MDTSKQYIKMCDCKEIQDIWKEHDLNMFPCTVYDKATERVAVVIWMPKKLEELVSPGSNCIVVSIECQREKQQCIPPGEYSLDDCIWLPQQDQLQEMVGEELHSLVYDFSMWNVPFGDLDNPYAKLFTSMEQLWLAFVMKEKFGKVWSSDKWTILINE